MGDTLNTDNAVELELRGPFFRTAVGDWIGCVPAGLAKQAGDIDQPNLPHLALFEKGGRTAASRGQCRSLAGGHLRHYQ